MESESLTQPDCLEERKDYMSNGSSGDTTEKARQSRPAEGADWRESDQQNHKRRLDSPAAQDGQHQANAEREKADPEAEDSDTRRQRRRVTNRESAKRMRMKRQEELANIQKELKRVKSENEQLRTYSGYLQKQHMMMSTEAQHWRTKCTGLEDEVSTLFQQLQQIVALAAAAQPGILDAVTQATTPQLPPMLGGIPGISKLLPTPKMPASLASSLGGSAARSMTEWQRSAAPHSGAPPPQSMQPPLRHLSSTASQASTRLAGGDPKRIGMEFRLPMALHSSMSDAVTAGEHGHRPPPPTKILLETQVDLSAVTGIHASS